MEQYSVIGSVHDCKSGASGVGGSSPSCSTMLSSTNSPGRHPFKVEIRVQFSLGVLKIVLWYKGSTCGSDPQNRCSIHLRTAYACVVQLADTTDSKSV